jgi:hypothetical protein
MAMMVSRNTLVGWVVAAVVIGAADTACDTDKKTLSPSPPSSSAPASFGASSTPTTGSTGAIPPVASRMDYSALLIKPGDIAGDFNAPNPPALNPNGAPGVAQLFANPDNSRRIGDTILILADPATAGASVDNTKANYAGKVSGTWQPVDIGAGGSTISGTSPDNSQAITVLVFSEGKAIVNMEFDGAANDPIDPAVAADIGRKQDAAVKGGLPG